MRGECELATGVKRTDISGVVPVARSILWVCAALSVHSPKNGKQLLCFHNLSPSLCSGSASGTVQVCSAVPLMGMRR